METPRKFITAKLSIHKPGSSSVLIICHQHISTDEDPGLESQLDSHYVKISFRQASKTTENLSLPLTLQM